MIKKTITYLDFNDNQRTEDHYFNLTKAEVLELQTSMPGGMAAHLERMIQEQDITKLANMFTTIIEKSYGIRSEDGRYFEKTPDAWTRFKSSNAYSELLIELLGDENLAAEFINKLLPAGLTENQDANRTQPQDRLRKEAVVSQMQTPPAPQVPNQAANPRPYEPTQWHGSAPSHPYQPPQS